MTAPRDTVQVNLRVPRAWMEQANQIASRANKRMRAQIVDGVLPHLGTTDGFRIAIAAGFEALKVNGSSAQVVGQAEAEDAKSKLKLRKFRATCKQVTRTLNSDDSTETKKGKVAK